MTLSYRKMCLALFGIIITSTFNSCQTEPKLDATHKNAITKWYMKTILLPWDELYKSNIVKETEFISISQKDLKILTLIDTSCPVCIKELEKWTIFKQGVDTSYVGFVFILYSTDQFISLDEELIKNILKHPYIKDIDGKIFRMNCFPLDKKHQTFLLNSKNQVVLIGSPNQNLEMFNLYRDFIGKYYEKRNISGVLKEANTDTDKSKQQVVNSF